MGCRRSGALRRRVDRVAYDGGRPGVFTLLSRRPVQLVSAIVSNGPYEWSKMKHLLAELDTIQRRGSPPINHNLASVDNGEP